MSLLLVWEGREGDQRETPRFPLVQTHRPILCLAIFAREATAVLAGICKALHSWQDQLTAFGLCSRLFQGGPCFGFPGRIDFPRADRVGVTLQFLSCHFCLFWSPDRVRGPSLSSLGCSDPTRESLTGAQSTSYRAGGYLEIRIPRDHFSGTEGRRVAFSCLRREDPLRFEWRLPIFVMESWDRSSLKPGIS